MSYKSEESYFEVLRSRVIARLKGDQSLKVDNDGVLELYAETKISVSTLKRIFGIDNTNPDYFPSIATRHRLAKYLGYKNWPEFVKEVKESTSTTGLKPITEQKPASKAVPDPKQKVDFSFFFRRINLLLLPTNIILLLFFIGNIYSSYNGLSDFKESFILDENGNKLQYDGILIYDIPSVEAHGQRKFIEKSIHLPPGTYIQKVSYELSGEYAAWCLNPGFENHATLKEQKNVEIDSTRGKFSWKRLYTGRPCKERYIVFYKKIASSLPKIQLKEKITIKKDLDWLFKENEGKKNVWCRSNVIADGESLGRRSGRACIREALIYSRNGDFNKAIQWLIAFHCQDGKSQQADGKNPEAMERFHSNREHALFYLETEYGKDFQDYDYARRERYLSEN